MKIIILNNDIRLVEESFSISIKISFSAIALLVIAGYIVIVTFFIFEVVFEADESGLLIRNKSNVFRMRNSYKI